MNITQEKIGDQGATVKVVLTPEDYTAKVEKALKDQAKKANLPGFRKGMVPVSHMKRMYGKSILVEEINNLLSETLNTYLTDNKIESLGQPLPVDNQIEYKWDNTDTFEFEYELGLAPEIKYTISSKDEFTQYVVKADPKTLEDRIKNIRRSYGKMTNPEVAEAGDVLYGDFVQMGADGTEFEDGIKNTASLRLDLVTDKAILKKLIGLKKEDEVVFNLNKALDNDATQIAKILKIEEADASDLKSDFKLTVKNVNRLEESDLNQEFFDKIFGEGEVTDEAGFRANITSEIESMFAEDANRKLSNDIYAQLLEKETITLPDDFLKRWLKATNEKLTDEELAQGYDDFAQNLKWTLIENKIMKDNNIDIKYEDVFQAAKERLRGQFAMYNQGGMPEDQLAQYAAQFLKEKDNANRILDEVKAIKTFDFVKSVATLKNVQIDYDKFLELVKK